MDLEACLPFDLRGVGTTVTRIAAGFSRARVYRVEAPGRSLVLKISGDYESAEVFRNKVLILQLAAKAGLAPRVVHSDEQRRAVVSQFVVDRSFPIRFTNPNTREPAIAQLGRT